MGLRGRGSSGRGSRGSRGGSRGRGRGRGGFRGGRGGHQNGSAPIRNGFKTSRIEETQNASGSEEDQSAEEDIPDNFDAADSADEQSVDSEDDTQPQRSYSALLDVLNAKSMAASEPPTKKRKIAEKATKDSENGSIAVEPTAIEREDGEAEAGLTEEVDEDEEVLDSDDEDVILHDPFEKHYSGIDEKELAVAISAVDGKQKFNLKSNIGDEALRKVVTLYGAQDGQTLKPIPDKGLRLKQRLAANGSRVYKTLTMEEKDVAREMLSYKDIQYGHRTVQNVSRLRDLACLHTLNHIFKTRDRVLKNNAKSSRDDLDDSVDLRDQGFTRPKVLVIVPTKQACVRFIQSIVDISEPDQQENKSRFLETYSADDDDAWQDKPDDFQELFGGNHEEDFRVGLKFTRKTIKYFSGFYNSDVIFGSALGLMRTITTGGGGSKDKKKVHDADFLSSIEVVIVDNASAIQMQNWQHLEYIFTQLNLLPKDSHGCDFSRVRNTYLDGKSRYLRQTILFTSHHTPEINSLISTHTHNISGLAKYTPFYPGTILSLPPTLPFTPLQTFLRFDSPDPTTDPDTRFTHFTTTILPSLLPTSRSSKSSGSHSGTLLYIPSYADFTRLRNHLSTSASTSSLSFGTISEYTPHRDVARARSHFMTGRHSLLVYTERAHHHFRYKLKGVKRIVFYGIPENEKFWDEVVTMVGFGSGRGDDDEMLKNGQKRTVRALFSRWDALKLERVVGTERVARLIGEKGGDVFEFV